MNVKRFLGKCRKGLDVINLKAKPSYSQAGEDMIVNYLFQSLQIQHPTYLEIGTNQPVQDNNTYFFYRKGSRGVCIEPDPSMVEQIRSKRPGDVVLNIGIGITESANADFFLFPGLLNAWSTFSEEEAVFRQKESGITPKKISIPLRTINEIIEQYFKPHPNFVSLDVEGLDLAILKSLDMKRFRPEVICVETITFSTRNTERKLTDIGEFMHANDYLSYADTHINTIFCRKDLFK